MASVLTGFVTIFIGVFMVNDAKIQNESLLSKGSFISMHSISDRIRASAVQPKSPMLSEFQMLKTFDDDAVFQSEDERI